MNDLNKYCKTFKKKKKKTVTSKKTRTSPKGKKQTTDTIVSKTVIIDIETVQRFKRIEGFTSLKEAYWNQPHIYYL
jgi:hypothetical protein